MRQKIKDLIDFEIIDIFTGKNVPEGQKSVTIRLVFGSDKRTLEEEEIIHSQELFHIYY